jgi:HEAT repeat protein
MRPPRHSRRGGRLRGAEALADEHWRVREMAAKVVARHRIGAALDRVAELRDDPVPRVRAAAERAIVKITAAGSLAVDAFVA